jgi:hypothetical protein
MLNAHQAEARLKVALLLCNYRIFLFCVLDGSNLLFCSLNKCHLSPCIAKCKANPCKFAVVIVTRRVGFAYLSGSKMDVLKVSDSLSDVGCLNPYVSLPAK